jgi:glyoxylase-like metal-dependent hydrolase (beta-lactamase superfamily II)
MLGAMLSIASLGTPAHAQKKSTTKNAKAEQAVEFTGELDVMHVKGNVYLIGAAGGGAHAVFQIGPEGVVLVDTQTPATSNKIIEAIRKVTREPLRIILNTSYLPDHSGGNVPLFKVGRFIGDRGEINVASIKGHEGVLNRMSGVLGSTPSAEEAWPTDVYYTGTMDLHMNGEPVILIHYPAAATDGDSAVFFRGSDVVVAGEIFTPDSYPVVDPERGGSLQGVIDGLNRIIDLTVPVMNAQGGTLVVPAYGPVADEYSVVVYRDALTIIRDRIADLIKRGMSLDQVKAAKPTLDYDGIYGTAPRGWTTNQFVAAVYRELSAKADPSSPDAATASP